MMCTHVIALQWQRNKSVRLGIGSLLSPVKRNKKKNRNKINFIIAAGMSIGKLEIYRAANSFLKIPKYASVSVRVNLCPKFETAC